jgi:hypothetical protein
MRNYQLLKKDPASWSSFAIKCGNYLEFKHMKAFRQQSAGMGCQQLCRQILLQRNLQLSSYLLWGAAIQMTVYYLFRS